MSPPSSPPPPIFTGCSSNGVYLPDNNIYCKDDLGSGTRSIWADSSPSCGYSFGSCGYEFTSEATLEGQNLFSNAWSYVHGPDFTLHSSVLAAFGCSNHAAVGSQLPQSFDGGTNGTWTEFAKLGISQHENTNPSIDMFRADLQPGTYRLRCDGVWSTGVFLRKANTGYDL